MERVPTENEMLLCPYEKVHMIMRCKMPKHLILCRRTHTNLKRVTCPFNIAHVMPDVELDFHVTVCPERKYFECFKYGDSRIEGLSASKSNAFSKNSKEDFLFSEPALCTESWDEDPPVAPYDPVANCMSKAVIMQPVGMTPSQRSEFRNNQRIRLRNLRESRKEE